MICVVHADGSNHHRLTDEIEVNADPHWTPDGSRVIYYSERDGNDEIYIMNISRSEIANLSQDPADDWYPSWSSVAENP